MKADDLYAKLHGTELGDRINAINTIYEDLEKDQKRFCDTFNITCKSGCGSCCENFVPDMTRVEAEYMALGLASEDRHQEALDIAANWKPETQTCPLYRSDTPFHCSVYRWRPLVCRLFGASAVKGKDGKPQFRHCKWNQVALELSTQELEAKPEDVVLMSDYGMRLEQCIVADNQRELLPQALGRATFELDMILRYASGSEEGDGGMDVPPESHPSAS